MNFLIEVCLSLNILFFLATSAILICPRCNKTTKTHAFTCGTCQDVSDSDTAELKGEKVEGEGVEEEDDDSTVSGLSDEDEEVGEEGVGEEGVGEEVGEVGEVGEVETKKIN
jgi:hypothetical protein